MLLSVTMNILPASGPHNDSGRSAPLFPDACGRGAMTTTRAPANMRTAGGPNTLEAFLANPGSPGMIVLKRSDDRPPVRELSLGEPAEPSRAILLVEDVADAADVLALSLELCGIQVRVAATPPDALALAVSHHFDAAILDIGLKHAIDGIDLGIMLRELPGNGNLPLIALSGWQNEDARAGESDFDAYLLKPVALCHLLDVVHAVIRQRQCVGQAVVLMQNID